MDTIVHGAMAYVITDVFDAPMEVSIAHGIIGAMPDIIGYAEKVIYWDFKRWNWYLYAHTKMKYMYVFIGWLFHILLDKHSHGKNKKGKHIRWWKWRERLWLEVLCWVMVITIFLIKRIWITNFLL